VANVFEVRDEMEEAVESPLRKVQAAMTGVHGCSTVSRSMRSLAAAPRPPR
jgi:hypothetical protein